MNAFSQCYVIVNCHRLNIWVIFDICFPRHCASSGANAIKLGALVRANKVLRDGVDVEPVRMRVGYDLNTMWLAYRHTDKEYDVQLISIRITW